MYNTDLPTRAELPTSKQLLVSTLCAALMAALLLITIVLPAEYAIDPTGIGRSLGLTEMGEIKQTLAQETSPEQVAQQSAPEKAFVVQGAEAAPQFEVAASKVEPQVAPVSLPSDSRSVTLKPGGAAELKLVMNKGAKVSYRWSVNRGHVNFDTHGDSSSLNYYGYDKGRQQTQQAGELEAAFDGKHGWFWRNRSKVELIVTLEVEGDYQGIKRVL